MVISPLITVKKIGPDCQTLSTVELRVPSSQVSRLMAFLPFLLLKNSHFGAAGTKVGSQCKRFYRQNGYLFIHELTPNENGLIYHWPVVVVTSGAYLCHLKPSHTLATCRTRDSLFSMNRVCSTDLIDINNAFHHEVLVEKTKTHTQFGGGGVYEITSWVFHHQTGCAPWSE